MADESTPQRPFIARDGGSHTFAEWDRIKRAHKHVHSAQGKCVKYSQRWPKAFGAPKECPVVLNPNDMTDVERWLDS
jgi:hypothetical protein